MTRGYTTLCHTFADSSYAELRGPDIKFWEGEGLPSYEGGLDGFAECYPQVFATMLALKLVRAIPEDTDTPPN
jgi:hypothetical protein